MRTIFTLLFLSFFCKTVAQDLEKIKKADTLYVFFKEDSKNQMLCSSNKKDTKQCYESVKYFLEDYSIMSEHKKQIFYRFFMDYFLSYWFIYQNVNIKKDQSFLDKNKDLIVDYNFLEQIGYREAKDMFAAKQNIYLIESNCIDKKKVKLKKVKMIAIVSTD
jgi:hypothetical protein